MTADVWAGPAAVAVAGLVVGVIIAARGRRDTTDLAASRHTDYQQEYVQTLDLLRALEQEQGKLSDADYTEQRTTLLNRAADALRCAEDPTMDTPYASVRRLLESKRDSLGDEAVNAALAKLDATEAPASTGTMSPAWLGALYTLLGFAVVGGLYAFISSQVVDRVGDAPMTGIDPGAMDGGLPAPTPSAAPAAGPPPPMVAALLQRVAADPTDVEAHNELTEFAIGQQDLASAMDHNGEALRIAPDNADGRVYRAYLMMSIGRTDEAITLLEALRVEQPDHLKAAIYYGLMTLTANQPDKAIPALEQAIAANPEGIDFLRERLAAAKVMNGEAPAATAPAPTAPPAAAGAIIATGQLRLEDTIAATLRPTDILFISVRDPAGGPPLAAQRLAVGSFPMSFTLTEADKISMGAAQALPPLVDIQFRIDRDGDAMTREEGLPSATVRGLAVGASELFVELVP